MEKVDYPILYIPSHKKEMQQIQLFFALICLKKKLKSSKYCDGKVCTITQLLVQTFTLKKIK